MKLLDNIAVVLGSRVWLGLCALVLAAGSIRGQFDQKEQIDSQSLEQECRSDFDGDLQIVMARSLQRIEAGLRALARGDETGLAYAVDSSEERVEDYAQAVDERADAVWLCAE